MDTATIVNMGMALLAKERILKKDVSDYVQAVTELAQAVDADARLQKAFDNSHKQLEYIFNIIKEFKK